MPLIGTSGHVGHGKSALIESLTGRNPMHLKEEKERQMTIELGFGFIDSPSEPIGVIDVPGHERYIRHMIASLWALDAVLFVVALDDGVRPMTQSHWKLVRAQKIPHIFWVFTKSDLYPREELPARIQKIFQDGELGEEPSEYFCISNKTGEGIEVLKQALISTLSSSPGRSHSTLQLWIDRVFPVKGQGTVVTGSLVGGALKVGQELFLYPSRTPVQIRSLQTYHQDKEVVFPSSRVALKLKSSVPLTKGALLAPAEGVLWGVSWIFRWENPISEILPRKGKGKEIELVLGGNSSLGLVTHATESWVHVQVREPLATVKEGLALFVSAGGSRLLGVGEALSGGMASSLSVPQKQNLKNFETHSLPLFIDSWEAIDLFGGRLPRKHLLYPQREKEWGEIFGAYISLRWVAQKDLQRAKTLLEASGSLSVSELGMRVLGDEAMGKAFVLHHLARGEWKEISPGRVSLPTASVSKEERPLGESRSGKEKQILSFAKEQKGLFSLRSLPPSQQQKTLLKQMVLQGLLEYLGEDFYMERVHYETLRKYLLSPWKKGESFEIAEAKARLELPRRQLVLFLESLQAKGFLKRSENRHIVQKSEEGEGDETVF